MVRAVTPIPFVKARFFDRCGKPLAGGKVYTYEANTTTAKTTYKDPYGLTPNTNPIILDAAGEADIYLDGTYRIRITDRNDVLVNDVAKIGSWFSDNLQDTLDNISGAMDDAIKPALQNLDNAINTAAAAAAGANGWDDMLIAVSENVNQRQINDGLESIAQLLSIEKPRNGMRVYVKSYRPGLNKGGGTFVYDSTKATINDGGMVINGWVRQVTNTYLNVVNFGALGDGVTNDFDAFKRIENYMIANKALKNFAIHLPTPDSFYSVNGQSFKSGQGFTNQSCISIDYRDIGRATGDWDKTRYADLNIVIKSDNAVIKQASGQYYGVFDKNTKAKLNTVAPFGSDYNNEQWTQYKDSHTVATLEHIFMFHGVNSVNVFGNLELDGNRDGMTIGGQIGDYGWQCRAYGLVVDNVRRFDISNVYSHHHCTDGVYVSLVTDKNNPERLFDDVRGVLRQVVAKNNSRNNVSITGGNNISAYDCNFDDGGLKTFSVYSAPMSCVDIEAESGAIRNLNFYNCYFGNAGAYSVTTYAGDIKGVNFYNCKIINPSSKTIWIDRPQVKFVDCYINGLTQRSLGTNVEADRMKFIHCTFTDDPSVNIGIQPMNHLIDIAMTNPILIDCTIDTFNTAPIFDDLYGAKLNKPLTMLGGTINIRKKTDYKPTMQGIYEDVVINDLREDPTVNYPIASQGSVFKNVRVESASGQSGVDFWNDLTTLKKMSGTLAPSNPYHSATGQAFYLYGAHTATAQNINNLVKVGYSTWLSLIATVYYNSGDIIFCTDSGSPIDKWICREPGLGSASVWQAQYRILQKPTA